MDDEQHRREEEDRRAKRKANKLSKSEAQIAKERKRDEHRKKILKQQGGSVSAGTSPSRTKDAAVGSKFQELFNQRAQGFQIDFRFRNAPPRPPVGPTFVGQRLEVVLNDLCRQYKQHNAVETNFTWRLHSEPDLGVPLAPSAMDLKSYPKGEEARGSSSKVLSLHPDDDALLNWKGSMGDTAADNLKKRQERARAATRAALGSKSIAAAISSVSQYTQRPNKKAFSRVLDEGMQSWMKKTTYLSNDYSRKVHDFKSLAQTKQELAIDLATKQEELSKHRSVYAVNQSFDFDKCPLQHPTKKNMQPKSILPLLPNVSHYGRAYTHVVIDKAPVLEKRFKMQDLDAAFIAHVEKKEANARMTCQLLVPTTHNVIDDEDEALAEDDTSSVNYQAAQAFNLDVVPLKEDESPHVNFCFWIDERTSEATYLPISSRVQLSSGRPIEDGGIRRISRRELTITEQEEIEEGMAEVDADMAEKHHVSFNRPLYRSSTTIRANTDGGKGPARSYAHEGDDDDDQEEDFGDDNDDSSDSGDEVLFGAAQKTIIAER